MKVMVFIDYDNFCQSIWQISTKRQPLISKLPEYLLNYLCKNLNFEKYNPELIRTYCYTGEYATTTISKIKKHLELETQEKKRAEIEKVLNDAARRQQGQKEFFYRANDFEFFELRTKPLQYSRKKAQLFQKGIDVQLAVDLVAHAHNNSFDVAILCSGDVDLLEAIKLVKNQGKKIIVFSHSESVAKEMRKEADFFINLQKLKMDDVDSFSYEAKNLANQKNDQCNSITGKNKAV